jgi:putative sigma-54 modulation protein
MIKKQKTPPKKTTGPARTKARAARAPGKATKNDSREAARYTADSTNMKLILSTHNVTLTDAIESHIMSRIEQLGHLDPRAINARVVIEHDHAKVAERQFKCSIRVTEPGPDLFAEDAESDLYAAIDLVAKKIEQQIRKRHGKFKARNHTEAAKGKRERQEEAI